jgi:hypothetical protein
VSVAATRALRLSLARAVVRLLEPALREAVDAEVERRIRRGRPLGTSIVADYLAFLPPTGGDSR